MSNNSMALRSRSRIFLAALFLTNVCHGASQGPNSAGTGGNDAAVGTVAWSTTSNITNSDNSYATCSLSSGQTSNYLTATNFSFSIPGSATISDISVAMERSHSSAVVSIVDSSVRIIKGGTIGSYDASSGFTWNNSDAYQSYTPGLWSESWTASDINSSTFGAAFSATYSGGLGSTTLRGDHVRITVTYIDNGVIKQMWSISEFFD